MKKINTTKIWTIILTIIISITSFIFIFPFLYTIVTAFKTELDTINNPALLTLNLTVENFKLIASSGVKLGAYYINSVIIAGISTLVVVIISAAAGYGFAKFSFKTKRIMIITMLLTMTFPLGALLIPMYIMEFKLNIADRLIGLILPNIAVNIPFAIFITQAIFMTVPDELIDYAEMDGCSPLRTWWQIMIPVAKNGLITAGILCFRSVWGEYTMARTLSSSVRSIPLSVGLTYLKWERWHFGIMSAVILLAIIPPVIIFLIFRNYVQRGLALGAVKG